MKVTQKWVPKVVGPPIHEIKQDTTDEILDLEAKNDNNDQNGIAMNNMSDVSAPSLIVDPSLAGGPPLVVESNTDITLVVTHVHQTAEVEEEPWKLVTRKSEGRHVASQTARVVSYNTGYDSGRPGVLGDQVPILMILWTRMLGVVMILLK